MRSIRVNIEDFDSTVKKESESSNPLFVLFFGTEKSETNASWCSDCVIADPLIRKVLSSVPNAVLIEAPVGLRDEWKGNTTHPYRRHAQFDVPAIPTLYKWSLSGPGDRLVEEECASVEGLTAFVQSA
ncbi:hypothetical protein BDF14DRAFT_1838901 [Spinellus fusiger]|nr:hypothetical protein BDF14DRAFT_1838901 [Spinellus fusiger]